MENLLNQRTLLVEESLIRRFNIMAQEKNAKYFLTLGEPDFSTPEIIKSACIKALDENKTKYSSTIGNLDFRKKICEFESRVNQIQYDESEVMITTGSTEAITSAIFTLLNPGDEVILLTPTYPLYKQIITFAGGQAVTIDTSQNNFQVTAACLEKAISPKTKAIIVTSPNNPTGTILSDESLEAIYLMARSHNLFILSDECYNQIVYGERRLGISKFQDLRDRLIICQSFSKPYAMPGWRLGYMLAPKEFLKHAMKMHQYMVVCVNNFIQDAGMVALDYEPTEMVEAYRVRRDYVFKRLKAMGMEVTLPEGAFYMFPSIKKYGLTSWEFCSRLVEEQGVALIPGECFEADHFIRISYCVEMEVIISALNRLEIFLQELEIKE